jgi:AcrR family transcriptional regulator
MAEHMRIAKQRRRPYNLRARAEAMDRTRARITQAAIELHGTIGPAATTMSAVADRAGVTRATLYRHFPTDEVLYAACSSEWLAAHPRPVVARWAEVEDPVARVRLALREMYAYYRATEAMMANILRDLRSMPERIQLNVATYVPRMVDGLDRGWPTDSGHTLRRAAIAHAVAFDTWRSLAREGVSDDAAADLMTSFVSIAGGRRRAPRR